MRRNLELESEFKCYFEELDLKDWQSAQEVLNELQQVEFKSGY